MKKLFILPLAAFTLFASSCSEKFKVAAPYKDVTVVYSFLDMNDTAHYIRIEKGFLDENKSSLTMAKTADSNYYNNISVRIERYKIDDGSYADSFHINRVDLAAEGYPKQPGTFFESPNYAYKFTDILSARHFYRLKITNLTTGRVDSADAPVIDENKTTGFNVSEIDDDATNELGLDFHSVIPNRVCTFGGRYPIPSPYKFKGQLSPVSMAHGIIGFNWDDVDAANVHTHRHYDFDAGYVAFTKSTFQFSVPSAVLYNALNLAMGDAPAGVKRLLDRCDITVYVSTPDYQNYKQALDAAGTGLTGSDITPVYTNIQGENAIGLFTSRAVHTGKITITSQTVDSLFISPIMANNNIRGTVY